MKTVFSNSELVHVYAQQSQEHGRSGSMFFEYAEIYSYGRHYLLGEFKDPETILINDTGYSNTTSKHIGLLTSATTQYKQFFVTRTNSDIVFPEIKSLFYSLPKARTRKVQMLNDIKALWQDFNEYLDYLNVKEKWVQKSVEYDECLMIVKGLEADTEAIISEAKEYNKKQEAKRKLQTIEEVKKFKMHETFNLYKTKTKEAFLRLSEDRQKVETSLGVKIEVKQAKVLSALIQAGKDIKGFKIDYYTVLGVVGNYLKIGCHNIPLSEVEFINKELNSL